MTLEVSVDRLVDAPVHRVRRAIDAACHHDLGRVHTKRFSYGAYDITHRIGPTKHTFRLYHTGPYVLIQMSAKGRWPGFEKLGPIAGSDHLRFTMKAMLNKIAYYAEILPRGGSYPEHPVFEVE